MSIKHIKLLLVEDDLVDRRSLPAVLRQLSATLDIAIKTAKTLAEALNALKSECFDLVLLDLNLPDSHGLATVDSICVANAHVPIVVLTGLSDEQVGIEAIKRGASDYVVKGPDIEDVLCRAICYSLERKQIEMKLRESEKKYKTLYESSRDSIMMLAPPSWKFIGGNSATLEMFCATNEAEFTCMGPWDVSPVIQPDGQRSADKAKAMINRAMQDGSHFFEWQHQRCDGREFPATILLTRISVNDTVLLQATVRDITQHKQDEQEKEQLQAQLRQTQKIQAIGTLAGGIAHDFNNILMAIMGYTDLALQCVPEESQVRRNLGQVLIAGNRAKELIKQILCFSRKADQAQEPIDIASVVKEALRMLRSSIPTTVKIDQHVEAANSYIMANPTQIHQVLVNLCTNAVHAMEDKGGALEVRLAASNIESIIVTRDGTLPPGPYMELTIKDTGSGMDEEVIPRIFEPFYTTKTVDKGTGMGLSVVHGIVESHNGVITVDSELGKGTTFTVFFPRIDYTDTPVAASSNISVVREEAILLVDDESAIVDVMTQMLERFGYRVVGHTSSTAALDVFRNTPDRFDLVITDHTMPALTGIQLARELIDIRPDIPVILCSGFADDVAVEETMPAGIRNLVAKPVVGKEMAVLITHILDQKEVIV